MVIDDDAAGIAALADPTRRRLYDFVCAQPAAVSRDQAADAVGVAHHQAKFHLDKLEAEGLLTSEYVRLGGRSGPGAGRPSKVYRRADREIAVSLPPRDYALAGRLMADAITEASRTGEPVVDVLYRLARRHGRSVGDAAVGARGRLDTVDDALSMAVDILRREGYEPRRDEGRVLLVNCPFHALSAAHTELICGANLALISGMTTALEPHRPTAALDPAPGRCCVVLQLTEP